MTKRGKTNLTQAARELRQAQELYDAIAVRERAIWAKAVHHAETAYEAELTGHDMLYTRAIETAATRMRQVLAPTWEQYRAAMHAADSSLQAAIRKAEEAKNPPSSGAERT